MRPKTALPSPAASAPGPGTYSVESGIGKDAPAVSMSGRQEQKVDSFQPGPGTYAQLVKPIGSEAPSYTMAARPAGSSASDAQPGPGSYSYSPPPASSGITLTGRPKQVEESWKVGPGAYTLPRTDSSPAYSMTGRPVLRSENSAPGPGAYSLASELGSAPAASISGRHELRSDVSQPGPGTYSASYAPVTAGQRSWRLRPAWCSGAAVGRCRLKHVLTVCDVCVSRLLSAQLLLPTACVPRLRCRRLQLQRLGRALTASSLASARTRLQSA